MGCYSQSKALATQAVLDAFRERGLKVCVVHPSGILGPKDYAVEETTGTVIKIMQRKNADRHGRLPEPMRCPGPGPWLHRAADKGRDGECYILGNKEVTLKEMCRMLHEASGCKTPTSYLPIRLAYILAGYMERRARKTGEKPLMTDFAVYNLARNNQFDYSKAEKQVGISYQTL